VAHIDDLDTGAPHAIEDRHDVATAQHEGRLDTFIFQRSANEFSAINHRHCLVPLFDPLRQQTPHQDERQRTHEENRNQAAGKCGFVRMSPTIGRNDALGSVTTEEGNAERMALFDASVDSLSSHVVPAWFDDAKFGIFIHWGLFSVPAFAPRLSHVSEAFTKHYRLSAVMTPYTEWYDNAIRVPESPSAAHHARHWGGRPYADFRAPFAAGLEKWDPADWARLFKRAGARYVVLVTKHHDGYCLWPSEVRHPHRAGWHTTRDVVGDLAAAVRAEGLRFGVYYSGGIDWSFNRQPVRTLVEFVGSTPTANYPGYAEAQVRELIDRYAPSILWNDISWPTAKRAMLQLMADYYEAVPEGVLNDRWAHRNWLLKLLSQRPVQIALDAWLARRIRRDAEKDGYEPGIVPPEPVHYDFRTPEYTSFDTIGARKWEATRGMSPSFGYNRCDREDDYEDPTALLHSFIDVVSKNGNLLLNVGPTGEDAAIPSFQRQRLEFLGSWVARNGEAVYGTRPWSVAEGRTHDGIPVRFTCRAKTVYAIILGRPSGSALTITLPASLPAPPHVREVSAGEVLDAVLAGQDLTVNLAALAEGPAHVFALCGSTPRSASEHR
jgi:alpha-L-fucosidase